MPLPYTCRDAVLTEMDPEGVWRATVEVIRAACDGAAIPSSAIDVVAMGSQAQTFGLFGPDGSPRSPLISWLDRRASDESDEMARRFGDVYHDHCSFAAPSAFAGRPVC